MGKEGALAISPDDIAQARARLEGVATVTPLIDYPELLERLGGRVLVKFEGAQRDGSFKFRGAYNRLVQLSSAQRAAGVVAWSSGNHAQGVAAAARILNVHAAIVMPADAPAIKIGNSRALGAEIILYDRATESREAIAEQIASERGAIIVPSFDDPDIIAGQGTIGLEILDQAAALDISIDQLLVPCGGGGLVAGVAMAVRSQKPDVQLFSVEPNGHDDTARSLAAGRRLRNIPNAKSTCDALLAPEPGALTFPINQHFLAGGLVVDDSEVVEAMEYAFRRLRLVTEPGGAVALAACLTKKIQVEGKNTVIVISGANVDPDFMIKVISGQAGPERLNIS